MSKNDIDMNDNYLEYSFIVGSCDMDLWGNLKPTVILNICQEVAYMHSTRSGFGFEKLMELGTAWVLSRAAIEIDRLPKWGEQITVRTWHKGQSGLFSLRDYIFFDAQGEEIIRATTSWLIINIMTRRITRVDRLFSDDQALRLIEYPNHAIEQEAARVVAPVECCTLSEHAVTYSDLDVNHHVNNARYLEWICDNSPQQMEQERHLSHIVLNFNHEAKHNECVSISATNPMADKIVMSGTVEGRDIFTAELNYTNNE